MRHTGTVYSLKLERGFGFILGADRTNIFFHVNHVEGRKIPRLGDAVSYEIGEDGQGRPLATNIIVEPLTQTASGQNAGVE